MKKISELRKLLILVVFFFALCGCSRLTNSSEEEVNEAVESIEASHDEIFLTSDLPTEYDGVNQEIVLNNNRPTFTEKELDLSKGTWQKFSDLDRLNRVGVANALIGKESFPIEKRLPKLTVKPTGWKQKRTGKGRNDWLYNRCHLIGHQLTGENDNMKNLMTGTRQFNTPHMVNYENQVKDYINLTGNHVRYRVSPHFIDDELMARGVQIEATSVETDDFAYNVYIFNVQDGYTINYSTGKATNV